MLFRGLKVTIYVAVAGILLGTLLGTITGFALQTRSRIARGIAGVYIWIIRATSLIVQALYVYFVIPKLTGFDLSSNTAGIIVITINSGAFIAEIVRGSLEGIDPGQKEAGLSLGLTPMQNYATISFKTIQAYTTGAIFYVVLISILIILQKQVERKIRG